MEEKRLLGMEGNSGLVGAEGITTAGVGGSEAASGSNCPPTAWPSEKRKT